MPHAVPPGSAVDLGEDTGQSSHLESRNITFPAHQWAQQPGRSPNYNLNKTGDFIEVLLHTHD